MSLWKQLKIVLQTKIYAIKIDLEWWMFICAGCIVHCLVDRGGADN